MSEYKERFFHVKKGTEAYNEYMNYINQREKSKEIVNILTKEFNLEFYSYIATINGLAFDNLKGENSKFLCVKYLSNGLRPIKKRSSLFKRYKELCKEHNLGNVFQPYLGEYFITKIGCNYSLMIDKKNEEIYIRVQDCEKSNKDDFIEIKGSEWYEIKENL